MTGADTMILLGSTAGGMAVGLLFFLALLRSTEALAKGGKTSTIFGLYIFRICLVAPPAWLAAQQGAWPLLAGLGGFLIGRFALKRMIERRA